MDASLSSARPDVFPLSNSRLSMTSSGAWRHNTPLIRARPVIFCSMIRRIKRGSLGSACNQA
eukprot:51878-Eustigmatos_ZCMA.PRE.1